MSEVVVYGDRRPYPVALITLNPTGTATFGRDCALPTTDHAELARHPAVVERVARIVEAKNAELPSYARIKRFAVLPGEFTEAGGELTPTQKACSPRASPRRAPRRARPSSPSLCPATASCRCSRPSPASSP